MARPSSGYKLQDGTEVPGTTTIAGRFKDSGGLMQWAFQQGKADKRYLYEEAEKAADIGTHVHNLVEWHIHGEEEERPAPDPTLNPDAVKRGQQGYENFLRWEDSSGLYIVSWEKPLVSEQHKFGGTPDGMLERSGRIGLGDWKSSNRVYADYLLQLAAYILLWNENFPDQPITDGADIIRFSKDWGDFEHRHFDDLSLEMEQFIALRACYERDKVIKKRV